MLNSLLAATLAAGFIVAGEAPAAIAREPAQQLSGASAQVQLRDEIARMTSLSPKEIEVLVTLKNAEKDAPFKPIVALHVECVKRGLGLGFTKFIDSVEFRGNPDGTFARHQT